MAGALPPGMVDMEGGDAALEARASFLLRLRAKGVRDIAVLRAMEAVPRALFVPSSLAVHAHRDIALPIACGQTLTEPGLVARMLEALGCGPGHRVLAIGVGSGYTTALLARLAREVVAVERFGSLATEAAARLDALGVPNVAIHWGDGLSPRPELGVFDRIVAHVALDRRPNTLLERLAGGGRLIYVAGAASEGAGAALQKLVRLVNAPEGIKEEALGPARLQAALRGRSQG